MTVENRSDPHSQDWCRARHDLPLARINRSLGMRDSGSGIRVAGEWVERDRHAGSAYDVRGQPGSPKDPTKLSGTSAVFFPPRAK